MLGHLMTGRWVLDLQEDDVYWCTAEPRLGDWDVLRNFAPWLNGATNLIRGGRFNAVEWYQTIERFSGQHLVQCADGAFSHVDGGRR